jgi:hypothetical protein
MQAIVVLVAETRETDSAKARPSEKRDRLSWSQLEIKPRESEEPTPPFWTWFIENPRGRGMS